MKELRVRSHLAFAFAFWFAMFSFDVFRRLKQVTLQEMGSVHICALYPVADTGFPVEGGGGGGLRPVGGEHQPLKRAIFSGNVCKNEKNWVPLGAGCVPAAAPGFANGILRCNLA